MPRIVPSRWRRGFVALPRGWLDHPVLDRGEPYCRHAAFAWLVENARYTPSDGLERGQLRASLRALGDVWRWTRSKVLRFLRDSRAEQLIHFRGTIGRTNSTLITICNYGDFVPPLPRRGTFNETKNPKTRNTLLVKEEESLLRKDVNNRATHDSRARAREDFSKFWEGYPNKVGKVPARHAYLDALDHATPAEILDGLDRYRSSKPAGRQWLNPATFLKDRRWLDETPADLTPQPNGRDTGPLGPPPPLKPWEQAILDEIRAEKANHAD